MTPIHTPNVAGLMLAAGRSRRFGSDKRQALFTDGRPLLTVSVEAANAVLPALWLVLRVGENPAALGVPPTVEVVFSATAEQGMGHSLAEGMEAVSAHSSAVAVAILLADMPWLQPASIHQLAALASEDQIVVPVYDGEPGHPVIFGRRFWPQLMQLSGDTGARSVLLANPGAVRRVAITDAGTVRDVDTPDALRP